MTARCFWVLVYSVERFCSHRTWKRWSFQTWNRFDWWMYKSRLAKIIRPLRNGPQRSEELGYGTKVICYLFDCTMFLFRCDNHNKTQPAKKHRPPNGVTGPRTAVGTEIKSRQASKYNDPEKPTIPATKNQPANFNLRLPGSWASKSPTTANASVWKNW